MKKKSISIAFGIILCSTISLFSCSNMDNNTTTNPPSEFKWTYNGTTHTASLDSAYVQYDLTPYLIIAITGTHFITNYSRKIYFSLSSFNPGTYNIIPGPGNNILEYTDELGFNHSGVSGSLVITSNANNRLSGNFSAIIAGPSGNEPITGSFMNVLVRP